MSTAPASPNDPPRIGEVRIFGTVALQWDGGKWVKVD